MLKTRIMPTLLHKDVGLVKGERFDPTRRVGSLIQAVKVYNLREVDELAFLDVTATAQGRDPDFALVDDFADDTFMPLTVGGGVRSVEHVAGLLRVGADKVALNTIAVEDPGVVAASAQRFGASNVVVSIDARPGGPGGPGAYEVWTRSGTVATGIDAVAHARHMEALGAGELLLTAIERDGTMEGYDLELIAAVCGAVRIPVIASGGAGSYADMASALRAGASAVAAASIFHFTEQTPREAKRHLAAEGFEVRL